ncbi:histidine kinase [Myroides sp. DW712]|uniref:histidine kinase n=1 Tax=Myroides sp. DW712 TaxID=3389800 RepID=UPI00397859BE
MYKYSPLILLLLFLSCMKQQTLPPASNEHSIATAERATHSLDFYLSLDTIPTLARQHHITAFLQQQDTTVSTSVYGHFLKGLPFYYMKARDSFAGYFAPIHRAASTLDQSWQRVVTFTDLNLQLAQQGAASPDFMALLYAQLDSIKKQPTPIDYQLYDVLANAYFMHRNLQQALHYTNLYFEHHPQKEHNNIQMRFYDISFLLAAELEDSLQAKQALLQLKKHVKNTSDSITLARYYDMEARYFALVGRYDQALSSSKRYMTINKKINHMHPVVYNNVATSFERNNQLDSAIVYYKKGIALAQTMNIREQQQLYGGLSQVYKRKGDYQKALVALDSSFAHVTRMKERINTNKIKELELQYQTKEKDLEISTLKENFLLQKQNFTQQRWITWLVVLFVIGLLSYGIILYRQRLLQEKNKRLVLENKKMQVEQRLLQLQLNPHFIYNSIANLQGLINQDNKAIANRYLVALSKLIRHILELNRRDLVPLSEDLQAVENYLQIQQMRYNHRFSFTLDVQHTAVDEVLIPPMLLQPFIENAIEHGFQQLDYQGELTLTIEQQEEQLFICIQDNGRGLQNMPTPMKKQSLSQRITQERLDILFPNQKHLAHFELHDLQHTSSATGVEVRLYIPLIYS